MHAVPTGPGGHRQQLPIAHAAQRVGPFAIAIPAQSEPIELQRPGEPSVGADCIDLGRIDRAARRLGQTWLATEVLGGEQTIEIETAGDPVQQPVGFGALAALGERRARQ